MSKNDPFLMLREISLVKLKGAASSEEGLYSVCQLINLTGNKHMKVTISLEEAIFMTFIELEKIVALSATDSGLLILVMDKGEANMNKVIEKLPPRLAEQRDFRILKVRVTDRENDPKERCNYNLTDLNDGLSWLLS